MLTGRRLTAERMDDPSADPAELAHALKWLRAVNRRLGGVSAALEHFKTWSTRWPRNQTIRIIDIGTGSADIPAAIAQWAATSGFTLHITAVDLHPVTVSAAREFVRQQRMEHLIEVRQADALRLIDAYAAGSFDYAHAGMFLHHLPDIEVMTALRVMDRLTTRGLIWNDLIRGWIGRVGVRIAALGAPEMVKHDGRVSIEAGFTKGEALDLANRVGLANVRYQRRLWARFTLVSEK